jgi:hypothetical protein
MFLMLMRWACIGKKWHPALTCEVKPADNAKDVRILRFVQEGVFIVEDDAYREQ